MEEIIMEKVDEGDCVHEFPPKEVKRLRRELESTQKQMEHYKFASESFEKRVLDLQLELQKKDAELLDLKEKHNKSLAARHSDLECNERGEPIAMRKLFIGGLPQSATDRDLFEYFSKYGSVVDAVVMKDLKTNKSRGFGFVVFDSTSMADAAQSARPHCIAGKEVETKRAIPKHTLGKLRVGSRATLQSRRVFVGGLKTTTNNINLKDYFETMGRVESVSVMEDVKSKRSRGFAYVTFEDSDVADKVALQKFHIIDNRKCEVKPAFSKIFRGQGEHPPGKMSTEGRDYFQAEEEEEYDGYGYPCREGSVGPGMQCLSHKQSFTSQCNLLPQRFISNDLVPGISEDQLSQYNMSSCNNVDVQTWTTWSEEFMGWPSPRTTAADEHAGRSPMDSRIRPIKNQNYFLPKSLKPY